VEQNEQRPIAGLNVMQPYVPDLGVALPRVSRKSGAETDADPSGADWRVDDELTRGLLSVAAEARRLRGTHPASRASTLAEPSGHSNPVGASRARWVANPCEGTGPGPSAALRVSSMPASACLHLGCAAT
jgi:hypothetical protein